jgi:hypothetical protein
VVVVVVCVSPMQSLPQLKRKLTKKERVKRGLNSHGITKVKQNGLGKRSVSGGPKLKSTQTYTYTFGKAVALLKKEYTLATHLRWGCSRIAKHWAVRAVPEIVSAPGSRWSSCGACLYLCMLFPPQESASSRARTDGRR